MVDLQDRRQQLLVASNKSFTNKVMYRLSTGSMISGLVLFIIILSSVVLREIGCQSFDTNEESNDTLSGTAKGSSLAIVTFKSSSPQRAHQPSHQNNRTTLSRAVDNQRKTMDQLERFAYNLTSTLNSTSAGVSSSEQVTNRGDDLDTSHSRLIPTRLTARSDFNEASEASDQNYGDDNDYMQIDNENYLERASSNLREKKAVKELTKMLSKGISGATDQVRLETLENWKRRQRERKVIKESRAKLYEDLLTAAINSHPERMKKYSTNKQGYKLTNNKESSASNLKSTAESFSGNQNIDPELATDAETVLQHLQGLSAAIEANTPAGYSTDLTGGGSGGSDGSSNVVEDSSETESDSQADPGGDSSESADAEEKPKKSSDERPLVRQFKKIKNQISQRRKQLEQIKKIFNVELAINPKDGTLVGKPTKSKKTRVNASQAQPEGYIDYTDDGSQYSQLKRKSPGKGGKMNELMGYLRENPEILASVMAELTVDADPSRQHSFAAGRQHEPDQANDAADFNIMAHSSRKSTLSSRENQLSDIDLIDNYRARRTGGLRQSSDSTLPRNLLDLSEPKMSTLKRRLRVKSASTISSKLDHPDTLSANLASRAKTAEALLLESLRDRQLMNLARLDLVLATKQQAIASNRSSIFSSLNSPSNGGPLSISRHDYNNGPDTQTGNPANSSSSSASLSQSNQSNAYRTGNNRTNSASSGQSDEEVLHHFMVVNPNGTSSDTGSLTRQLGNGAGASNALLTNLNHHQYSPSSQQHVRYNQPATLDRFRDWRDVSQSEASSTQHDKAAPASNLTSSAWNTPYDLSTGGSSSPADMQPQFNYRLTAQQQQHQQQQPQLAAPSLHSYQRPSFLKASAHYNDTYPPYSEASILSSSTQQVLADLSVTRPGLHNSQASGEMRAVGNELEQPVGGRAQPDRMFNSMFMTRSSVAAAQQRADLDHAKSTRGSDGDEVLAPAAKLSRQQSRKRQQGDSLRRNDSAEDTDDESDESDEQDNKAAEQQQTPAPPSIDYFSSYKQELPSKPGRLSSSSLSSSRQEHESPRARPSRDRSQKSDNRQMARDDGLGAMWAK